MDWYQCKDESDEKAYPWNKQVSSTVGAVGAAFVCGSSSGQKASIVSVNVEASGRITSFRTWEYCSDNSYNVFSISSSSIDESV